MHAGRQVAGKGLEVLPEHLEFVEILAEEIPVIKAAQGALKAHPVQAVQDAQHLVLVLVEKGMGSGDRGGSQIRFHADLLLDRRCPVTEPLASRVALRLRLRRSKMYVSLHPIVNS